MALFSDGSIVSSGGFLLPSTPDVEKPSTPVLSAASNITENSADLDWNDSTDNVGVVGYNLYVEGVIHTENIIPSNFTLPNLTHSTTYNNVYVRAKDAAGNLSDPSNSISFTTSAAADTTPPSVPGQPAQDSVTSMSVSFTIPTLSTDSESGLAGYKVYVDGVAEPELLSAGITTASVNTVGGLSSSTTYAISVSAVDNVGNESAQSTSTNITTSATVAATTWEKIDYRDAGIFDLGVVTESEIEQEIQFATKGVTPGSEQVTVRASGDGLNTRHAQYKIPAYTGGAHTFNLAAARFVSQTNLPPISEKWFEFYFYIPEGWITHNQGKIGFSFNGQNGTGAGNNPTTFWDVLFHFWSCDNNPKYSAKQGQVADPSGPHLKEDMVLAADVYWNDSVRPENGGYSEQLYIRDSLPSGNKKKFTHSVLYGIRGYWKINTSGQSDGILRVWHSDNGQTGPWTKGIEFTDINWRGSVNNLAGQWNNVPFYGGSGSSFHPNGSTPDKNNGIVYAAQDTFLLQEYLWSYSTDPGWGLS